MILKGLRLHGFKSFYRKVDLDFGSGITAIVGPNGCGKSNIADSIRWVLGEQNPRMLRGRRMDDTIFKGTQTRRALNMTEVSLTFDNSAGIVSLPYEEITITRKIFRSGESIYLINDTECRLKDVSDLISDMGIGRDAYSLIEQRMIDEILNGRSGERRHILEEAAGIVKYKERRRLAQRKLERTRRDLEQIQILVDEVERTVRGLKRHVGKARRYRAFREREREIETTLARREHGELSGKIAEISARLVSRENERDDAVARIRDLEGALKAKRADLLDREAALDEVRKGLKERMLRMKELDERLAVLRERRKSRDERLEAIRVELEEAAGAREGLVAERDRLEGERDASASRRAEIAARLEALGVERDRVAAAIEESAAAARAEGRKRAERLSRVAEIRTRLEAVEGEAAALRRRRRELEAVLEERERALEETGGNREGFAREIASLRSIVEKSSARLQELSRRREAVTLRRETSDREARKHQLVLNNVMAQLEMQQRWREEFEGFPPGVSAVMRARADLPGIIGPLADLFEIDEKFIRAIESGLGPYLRMVVTEDSVAAVRAIEYLRREGKGTVSFLPIELAGTATGPGRRDRPPG
jgi:chromosome segregation protein